MGVVLSIQIVQREAILVGILSKHTTSTKRSYLSIVGIVSKHTTSTSRSRTSNQFIFLMLEKEIDAIIAHLIKSNKGEGHKASVAQAVGKSGEGKV